MDTQIIFGAPIFNTVPNPVFRAPVGQYALFKKVQKELRNPSDAFAILGMEYIAILVTLVEMGIHPKILLTKTKHIFPKFLEILEEYHFDSLDLPAGLDERSLIFPRDLAMQLSSNSCLIDLDLKDSLKIPACSEHELIWSPYGQGGRMHLRKRVILINDRVFITRISRSFDEIVQKSLKFHRDVQNLASVETAKKALGLVGDLPSMHLQAFRKHISRIVLLPSTVVIEEEDLIQRYDIEDHVDRVSGLLEDRSGELHLVIDPQIYSGWQGFDAAPEFGPEETLARYRNACKTAKILVHTPKMSIPMSVGFWQNPKDLKVLMTSGDAEVQTCVEEIVGKDNVYTTNIPIKQFPVQCKAGIHCLINEFSPWFLDLISFRT